MTARVKRISIVYQFFLAPLCFSQCQCWITSPCCQSLGRAKDRPFSYLSSLSTAEFEPSAACRVEPSSVFVPLEDANARLYNSLRQNQTDDIIEIHGYITTKRAFGASFGFLDISHSQLEDAPVQVMMKRQDYVGNSTHFDAIFGCLVPGIGVAVQGCARPTRNPDQAVLLVQGVQFTHWPRNPQHVRVVLQRLLEQPELLITGFVSQTNFLNGDTSLVNIQSMLQEEQQWASKRSNEKGRQFIDPLQQVSKRIVANLPHDERYPRDLLETTSHSDRRYHQRALPMPPRDLEDPPQHVVSHRQVDYKDNEMMLQLETRSVLESLEETFDKGKDIISLIQLQGWVQNRRRYRGNITVLELVDEFSATSNVTSDIDSDAQQWQGRLSCVLHPTTMHGGQEQTGLYSSILAPGSQVLVQGVIVTTLSTSSSEPLIRLWVSQARLVRASWRPATLKMILERAHESLMDADEVARALGLSDGEMHDLLDQDLVQRQWAASEISMRLQSDASRTRYVTPTQLDILHRYEQFAKEKFPLQLVSQAYANDDVSAERQGSRWQRKKLPQLQWLLHQVQEICESHPDYKKRPLRILDVGGGRGLLANYLAEALPVEVHVMDIANRAIANGRMRSQRRALAQAVTYEACDASAATFCPGDYDVVVALHACGTLTDIALSHAVANEAAFVICPCCFLSNSHLLVRRRFTVEEWTNVPIDDYAVLKQLAEVQGDYTLASQATHAICALRADSVGRRSANRLRVDIKTFPVSFSTRNFAIVGLRNSC